MKTTKKDLKELKVESFTTGRPGVAAMDDATWNDATAGCCQPQFTEGRTCTGFYCCT